MPRVPDMRTQLDYTPSTPAVDRSAVQPIGIALRVGRRASFAIGLALLAYGVAMLHDGRSGAEPMGWGAFLAGLAIPLGRMRGLRD